MRKLYQTSWHGIPFGSFAKVSTSHLPDSSFYASFYEKFHRATGDTGRYAKVGLLMMGVSIPVTYLLLASPSAVVPGLGLAAVGLALKLVVLASIGVNLQVYLITKVNGWEFEYSYQVVVVACLLSLGWLCKWGAGQGLGISGLLHGGQVGVMILGGSLYAVLSLALLYRSPWLAGLTRDQIQFAVSSAARRLRLVDPVSSR